MKLIDYTGLFLFGTGDICTFPKGLLQVHKTHYRVYFRLSLHKQKLQKFNREKVWIRERINVLIPVRRTGLWE